MILYNTTFVMAPPTEAAFLSFMREVYIPTLQAEELVVAESLRLHRLLAREEQEETLSYALHFYTPTESHLQELLAETGMRLAEQLSSRFGEEVLGFSTIMQEVD